MPFVGKADMDLKMLARYRALGFSHPSFRKRFRGNLDEVMASSEYQEAERVVHDQLSVELSGRIRRLSFHVIDGIETLLKSSDKVYVSVGIERALKVVELLTSYNQSMGAPNRALSNGNVNKEALMGALQELDGDT